MVSRERRDGTVGFFLDQLVPLAGLPAVQHKVIGHALEVAQSTMITPWGVVLMANTFERCWEVFLVANGEVISLHIDRVGSTFEFVEPTATPRLTAKQQQQLSVKRKELLMTVLEYVLETKRAPDELKFEFYEARHEIEQLLAA